VRRGDNQAFAELYRRHREAAVSTARWLLRSRADADDVVADAFAGVLAAIQNGNGPSDDFRRYLLAAVRNGCRLRWQRLADAEERRRHRVRSAPMFEDPERYVEADIVARAFASLHPRWQQTLWLSEVEQRSTTEVGEQLRLAPNAAAALTHRAREAFATAYLAEHVAAPAEEACRRYADRLAAYVRGQLTDAQSADVEAHLAVCPSCARAVDDLRDLNASLRTLAPMAPSSLAVPLTVGTSMGAASNGLFSSALLLKGVATLLLVAPVVIVGINSVRHADGTHARQERAVITGPTSSEATATTVAPTSTSSAPTSTQAASTTSVIASAPVRQAAGAAGGAAVGAGPGRAVDERPPTVRALPIVDDVVTRLNPLLQDVVVPLVEDVVVTVLDVVQPLLDNVVAPAIGLVGNILNTIADDLSAVVPSLPLPDVVSIAPAPTTTVPQPEVAPMPDGAPSATATATAPPVTTPPTAVPAVTAGTVTLPPVTLPPVTTLPPLTLPPTTAPLLSVPSVTLPPPPLVPTTLLELLGQG
jgi:RNA polymerase sigma factor (sigma-70 family)